jgi:hypothetical protein
MRGSDAEIKVLLQPGHRSCETGTNQTTIPKTVFGFKIALSAEACPDTKACPGAKPRQDGPGCFPRAGAVLFQEQKRLRQRYAMRRDSRSRNFNNLNVSGFKHLVDIKGSGV